MSDETIEESGEQQSEAFTLAIVLVFICLVSAAADGLFELGVRLDISGFAGGSMKVLRFVALYVAPGLFCGFMWRNWGFAFGAGAGIVVRLLSAINLGMIAPYFNRRLFVASLGAGWQELPNFLVIILCSGGLGVACGLAGQLIARIETPEGRWLRWPGRIALLLLTAGLALAGGTWIITFMPWGGPERPRGVAEILKKRLVENGLFGKVDGPVAVLVWASLLLAAVCVALLLPQLTRLSPVKMIGIKGKKRDRRSGHKHG